jgi:hypothetical protein
MRDLNSSTLTGYATRLRRRLLAASGLAVSRQPARLQQFAGHSRAVSIRIRKK